MTDNDAAQPLARHPDRSIDDKFERVVAERDDLAGALVEAERERDKAEAERDRVRAVLAEARQMAHAFDTPRDSSRVRVFVGDLRHVLHKRETQP